VIDEFESKGKKKVLILSRIETRLVEPIASKRARSIGGKSVRFVRVPLLFGRFSQ
jgi:hypothetical protein